jgi:hypothetical protein
MSRIRICLTAIVFVALMGSGAAISQTPTPTAKPATAPAASTPAPPKPSTATQVETWSTKQWAAAKKEWAKETIKWADCRKQARGQNLEERNSWPFLYKCMTG